jgi:Transglycosylase SLT domain
MALPVITFGGWTIRDLLSCTVTMSSKTKGSSIHFVLADPLGDLAKALLTDALSDGVPGARVPASGQSVGRAAAPGVDGTGLSQATIDGLIYQESKGNPQAKAGATSAYGLMQMTTGARIDTKTDNARYARDPQYQIQQGKAYLALKREQARKQLGREPTETEILKAYHDGSILADRKDKESLEYPGLILAHARDLKKLASTPYTSTYNGTSAPQGTEPASTPQSTEALPARSKPIRFNWNIDGVELTLSFANTHCEGRYPQREISVEGQGFAWLLDQVPQNTHHKPTTLKTLAEKLVTAKGGQLQYFGPDVPLDVTVVQKGLSDWGLLDRLAQQHGRLLTSQNAKVVISEVPKGKAVAHRYDLLGSNVLSYTWADTAPFKDGKTSASPSASTSAFNSQAAVDPETGKQVTQASSATASTGGFDVTAGDLFARKRKLVALGQDLQKRGFQVAEHPNFGGVCNGCHDGRGHYEARALDVNAGAGESDAEKRKLDALRPEIEGYGFKVLWRVENHFNHMHIEVPVYPQGAKNTKTAAVPQVGQVAGNTGDNSAAKELQGIKATLTCAVTAIELGLKPLDLVQVTGWGPGYTYMIDSLTFNIAKMTVSIEMTAPKGSIKQPLKENLEDAE